MNNNQIKGFLKLSLAMGVWVGLCWYAIFYFIERPMAPLGIFCGIAFALLLFITLEIYSKNRERKFKVFTSKITEPVLYSIDCGIINGRKRNYVRFCFCKEALIIVGVDQKPKMFRTIPYREMSDFQILAPYRLEFSINSDERLSLHVPAERIVSFLQTEIGMDI